MVAALAKLKSYLDYGTFQPIQIASIIALNEGDGFVSEVNAIYTRRRDVLIDGLNRAGWKVEAPKGTMFVWAPIPDPYRELGSVDFAIDLLQRARVAVSPGVGFGASGEGYVRFALVENEHRIAQAVRGLRKALDRRQVATRD
jgi:alanine-synthesizing transaminase